MIKTNKLTLKEHTRDEHYKVIEQEGISSIFNSEVLSYNQYVSQLSKHINMFIIDSLFFDVNYIKEVIRLFKLAINGEDIDKQLKELNKDISFTDGFKSKMCYSNNSFPENTKHFFGRMGEKWQKLQNITKFQDCCFLLKIDEFWEYLTLFNNCS